jgi:hypothetical protein
MKHSQKILIALLICLNLFLDTSPAKDFFVAPNGDDNNPGSRQKPLATPAGARELIHKYKEKAREPVKVIVQEGTYYQAEPLVFGPQDSGTADAPVTYQAQPGKIVTISGGSVVKKS